MNVEVIDVHKLTEHVPEKYMYPELSTLFLLLIFASHKLVKMELQTIRRTFERLVKYSLVIITVKCCDHT